MADRYLPIDEEGYFIFDGRRVDDEALGREMLENLKPVDERGRVDTSLAGVPAIVEAFDAPLVARHVRLEDGQGVLDLPYHTEMGFSFESLSLDEWDRFHGLTDKQIPFVFSRTAQYEFFDLLDSFDDDSVTVGGRRYPVPAWLAPAPEVNSAGFWTGIYQTEKPGWELGHESPVLPAVLPQLKLSKGRVLVLGCGSGNDAAYFAKQGFIVTAVDISEEALGQARAKYGEVPGLRFVQADVFALPAEFTARFDLVFEHTCYCAVSPEKRNDLVRIWKKALVPGGNLLGVFFAAEKRTGPPFGGSEWELRERLKSSFDFLYWTRWRQSEEGRKGREVVIFGTVK